MTSLQVIFLSTHLRRRIRQPVLTPSTSKSSILSRSSLAHVDAEDAQGFNVPAIAKQKPSKSKTVLPKHNNVSFLVEQSEICAFFVRTTVM